jgi:hypothetical protein
VSGIHAGTLKDGLKNRDTEAQRKRDLTKSKREKRVRKKKERETK